MKLKVFLITLFVFCGVMVWAQDAPALDEQCNIFLKFQNENDETVFYNPEVEPLDIVREDLESAELVYKCGEATYEIMHFTVVISDGQGSFASYDVKGGKFASIAEIYSVQIPAGRRFLLERINIVKEGERVVVAFPPLQMP